MRELPKTFNRDGFIYEQVKRTGQVAIYRQTKEGQHWQAFEVGRIRLNEAREMFGRQIEASESWPCSEEWGVKAWTYPDLAGAEHRMCRLIPQNAS